MPIIYMSIGGMGTLFIMALMQTASRADEDVESFTEH